MRAVAPSAAMYMPLAREEGAADELDDVEVVATRDDWSPSPPVQQARGLGAAMLGAFGALAGATLLFVAVLPTLQPAPPDADVGRKIEAFGGFELAGTLSSGITAAAKVLKEGKKMYPRMKAVGAPTANLRDKVIAGGEHPLLNISAYRAITGKEANRPSNNKNDGNLCPDDEEEAAGLCYKRCTDLTGGTYPIRTGAFSCCASWPCTFFNSKFTPLMNFCGGFDIAGDKEQGGCPHQPGDCYENEEFSLGMCYKRCALLTNNAYPYRAGADTCCRYNSHLACLDALNTFTNSSIGLGGGDLNPEGPEFEGHLPNLTLTEKAEHWT